MENKVTLYSVCQSLQISFERKASILLGALVGNEYRHKFPEAVRQKMAQIENGNKFNVVCYPESFTETIKDIIVKFQGQQAISKIQELYVKPEPQFLKGSESEKMMIALFGKAGAKVVDVTPMPTVTLTPKPKRKRIVRQVQKIIPQVELSEQEIIYRMEQLKPNKNENTIAAS